LLLGEPEFGTPFARVPVPGETLTYEQLEIQFLIDERMDNYKSLYNWMVALGFPQDYNQYLSLSELDQINTSELATNYSDATLLILNNNNQPSQVVTFYDLFPVSISSLQFASTNTDVNYLVGRANFRFSYYKFE
jgi:hypothetical protein